MPGSDGFIVFKQTCDRPVEFLHELNAPGLLRARELPLSVSAQLRREQVAKLRENIHVLREKQEEFDRKMDEYVANLQRLIESLASESEDDLKSADSQSQSDHLGTTVVRCMGCAREKTFTDLFVIFARESEESLTSPTQCYVSDRGQIKKGLFECLDCGSGSLLIQTR